MASLSFAVADIPEEGLEFTRQVGRGDLLLEEDDPATCEELTVSGTAHVAGSDILVQGELVGTLQLECVRCLTQFQRSFALSFEGLFVEGGDGEFPAGRESGLREDAGQPDEVERYLIHDECIELGTLLREQVILSVPMQPLCAEDCRGLCSQCGENLNVGSCDCPPVEVASPFSVLQNLVKWSAKSRTPS